MRLIVRLASPQEPRATMTIYEMASKAMLVEKKKLGCARGLAGKAGAPLRCEDGMEILNRWNAGQIAGRVTVRLEGDTNKFSFFIWTLAEKARRRIAAACGLECRGLVGSPGEQVLRRSASGGLPLLLRLAGHGSFHRVARGGKARRRRDEVGHGRLRFREQGSGRVDQCANHFGGRDGRGLERFMVIEHPSREQRLRRLLDPLVDQCGDFLAQIGRMI